MKQTIYLLLLLVTAYVCPAQNRGSITVTQTKPKAGFTNIFIYTPAKNLSIPDKIQAVVVYQNKQDYFSKTIRINKSGNNYQFSFKAPDSTSVLIFSITVPGKTIPDKSSMTMEKKTIFDNNNENGFIIYLYDKKGKRFTYEQLDLAALMNDYAVYELALKEKATPSLIKMYEDSYKMCPELKRENSYRDYLSLLYKDNPDAGKAKLLNYASELFQIKNDEKKWSNAASIYGDLQMTDEKKRVQNEIVTAFPNGNKAKENYWNNFYASHDTTKETLLASMNAHIARFKDNTAKTKDRFYTSLMQQSITHKDWPVAFKYGDLVNEKLLSAYQYDYNAWKLSGKQIDNPGTDLENAKTLSAKSITISTVLMNDGTDRDEDALNDLKEAHYKFFDTYALILYKLGQYDSAFYYQDLVSKQGKELNTGGMERYAAYAEKVKGIAFTKQYLESKLLTGTKSAVMLKQLQSIYKQQNLPEDEFSRLQQMSSLLAKKKSDEVIVAKYGALTAPDFSLKNIAGETVTLSDLKGKIVVLDFWATWCSPCKAAFPAMQQLVDKYKDDKDILFLFIDTWENETNTKNKEIISKYMAENKYSFNVLFDVKKKVVADYKIEEIPKNIIIDKNGNLLYTGGTSGLLFTTDHITDELSDIIEDAKKIAFNPNINNTKLPDPVYLHPKTKQK